MVATVIVETGAKVQSILERAESLANLVAGRGTEKISDKEFCSAVLLAKNIATDTYAALDNQEIDAATAAAINSCNGRVIQWVQVVFQKRRRMQFRGQRRRNAASNVDAPNGAQNVETPVLP